MIYFVSVNDQDGTIYKSGASRYPFCDVLILRREITIYLSVAGDMKLDRGIRGSRSNSHSPVRESDGADGRSCSAEF